MKQFKFWLATGAAISLAAAAHGQILGGHVAGGLGVALPGGLGEQPAGEVLGHVPNASPRAGDADFAPPVRHLGLDGDMAASTAIARNRHLHEVGRTALGIAVLAPQSALSLVVAPTGQVGRVERRYSLAVPNVLIEQPDVILPAGQVNAYMDTQERTLSHDLEGSGVTVTRRGELVVLTLPADVTFAFDKSDVQPRFWPVLESVARTLGAYHGVEVEIMGHTDAIGTDAYNYALSERRAGSVADFLAERATDPRRLVVEGFGKTEPIASNATIEGRAANRRVEIVLHPRTS